jgi:hypothetical protein
MKKSILIIILLLSINKTGTAEESFLYWDEKKLEWADFKGKVPEGSNLVSQLSFFIGYNYEKKGSPFFEGRYFTKCYINVNTSWAKEEFKNDQYLKYHQITFDIAELHRRKMQYELNRSTVSLADYNVIGKRIHQKYWEMCTQMISDFQNESNHGQNAEVIERWASIIEFELKRNPSEDIPEYSVSSLMLSMDLTFGFGYVTPAIGEYFSDIFLFDIMVKLSIKKPTIIVYISTGLNKVKKEYPREIPWPENMGSGYSHAAIGFGYPLKMNDKLSFMPYLAPGYTGIWDRDSVKATNSKGLSEFTVVVGLDIDQVIKKAINFNSHFKSETWAVLKYRLSFTPRIFGDELRGTSVNASIGIGIKGNKITRIKN